MGINRIKFYSVSSMSEVVYKEGKFIITRGHPERIIPVLEKILQDLKGGEDNDLQIQGTETLSTSD